MMTAPIVVGIDGSPAGLRAVDLAVREAGLRNRPVRLVYANTWTSHPAWADVASPDEVARRAVREALQRAGNSAKVTSEVVSGYPAAVLVEESERAALLVVGHRGHDSLAIFKIDPRNGALTAIGHESTRGMTPRNFAIDPTGAFLLVANQKSDSIVVFRLDQKTGQLSSTGQVAQVPAPVCLKFTQPFR